MTPRERWATFWNRVLDNELEPEEIERSMRIGKLSLWFGLNFAPALFNFLEWVLVAAVFDYARGQAQGFDRLLVASLEVVMLIALWLYYSSVLQEEPPPFKTLRESLANKRVVRRSVMGLLMATVVLFCGYRLAIVAANVQFNLQAAHAQQ